MLPCHTIFKGSGFDQWAIRESHPLPVLGEFTYAQFEMAHGNSHVYPVHIRFTLFWAPGGPVYQKMIASIGSHNPPWLSIRVRGCDLHEFQRVAELTGLFMVDGRVQVLMKEKLMPWLPDLGAG